MNVRNIAFKNQIENDKGNFQELYEILPSLFTRDQNNELFKTPQIPLTYDGRSRTQHFWQIIAITILKSTGIQKRMQNREELRRREEQFYLQGDQFQKSHDNIGLDDYEDLHHLSSNLFNRERSMRSSLMSHLIPGSQSGELTGKNKIMSEKIQKTFRNIFRIKKIFKKPSDNSNLEYRGVPLETRCWMLFVDSARTVMSKRKNSFDMSDRTDKTNRFANEIMEETGRKSDSSPIHDSCSPNHKKTSLLFDNISVGHSRPTTPVKFFEEDFSPDGGSSVQNLNSAILKSRIGNQDSKHQGKKRRKGEVKPFTGIERPRRKSCACHSCGDKTSKNFSKDFFFNTETEVKEHVRAHEAKLIEEKNGKLIKHDSKKVLIASGSLKVEDNRKSTLTQIKKVGTQSNLFGKKMQMVPLGLVDRRTSQQTLLVPATMAKTNSRKLSDDSQPSSPCISERSMEISPTISRKLAEENRKSLSKKKLSVIPNEEPFSEDKRQGQQSDDEKRKNRLERKKTNPLQLHSKAATDKKNSIEEDLTQTSGPKLRNKQYTKTQLRTQTTSKNFSDVYQDIPIPKSPELENIRVNSSQSNIKKLPLEDQILTERPKTQMDMRKIGGLYSARSNQKILASLKEMENTLYRPPKLLPSGKQKPNNHSASCMNLPKNVHTFTYSDTPLADERYNLPKLNDSSIRKPTSRAGNYSGKQQNWEEPTVSSKRLLSKQSARGIKSQSTQIQSIAQIYINPKKIKYV